MKPSNKHHFEDQGLPEDVNEDEGARHAKRLLWKGATACGKRDLSAVGKKVKDRGIAWVIKYFSKTARERK